MEVVTNVANPRDVIGKTVPCYSRSLKRHRQEVAKSHPADINAQWRLGQAYTLCKEYEKAIDHFTPLYRKNPDYCDIQYSILDALFALGKSERDFHQF
ncbi:MAG: tetratricopeptide repeat protein [Bacillota bacterium]|nr:tetratricopeptide repeat protein [Bacillota bacterium]